MKILSTPRMERCIGYHSCSLACARLVHKQLSWDKAGILIRSTPFTSTCPANPSQKKKGNDADRAADFLVQDEKSRVFLTPMVSCLLAREVYKEAVLADCLNAVGYRSLAENLDLINLPRKSIWVSSGIPGALVSLSLLSLKTLSRTAMAPISDYIRGGVMYFRLESRSWFREMSVQ